MENARENTCCFTGHRPNALPWRYGKTDPSYVLFKYRVRVEIGKAIENGYTHFISGMAQGVDMICARIVLDYKKEKPSITLECAIPCRGQENGWSAQAIAEYRDIIKSADKVTMVSDQPYYEGCMRVRNEYMVKRSSLLIAGFNGKVGGTKQTVSLAKKMGLTIKIINP